MITTWLLSWLLKVAEGRPSNTFIGKVDRSEGKIWLGGNDVIVLPDEAEKSFLETKPPQGSGENLSGEAKQHFWQLTQPCGGPKLLLNRLVPSTLSTAARFRPVLYSPPLHQRGAKEPRSTESRAATHNSSGPSQQQCKLAEAWAVLCSALLTVLTSHLAAAVMVLWKTLLAWMTLC